MIKSDQDNFVDEILRLLKDFTILAHKEALILADEIEYDYNFDGSDFEESKFLKFSNLEITESKGTYWIEFKCIGDLATCLESLGMPLKFTALLINEKFRDSMIIDETSDLKKLFYKCEFENKFELKNLTKENTEKAIDTLNKLLLFGTIKHS